MKRVLINKLFLIRTFVLIFFLFSIEYKCNCNSGDSIKIIIKNLRSKAKQYDKDGDIYNAIDYYSRYLHYKNKDVKSNYRLANLYFLTRNYFKARQYYDTVLILKQKKYSLSLYFKGVVCMNLADYDMAIESFNKFKKIYKGKRNRNEYWKMADRKSVV
jgi:tetratricopeptide (TPR) repeat protein